MTLADWLALLLLSILWGGSFFFVEIGLKAFPPLTLVVLRVGLAATALWVFILLRGYWVPLSGRVWLSFLGMGALNNVIPFSLIVWGQTQLSAGYASILNATTPLFTVLVAGALLADERATPQKLIGVGLGFVGVLVMVGPSAMTGLGDDVLASLAILGAALSYGFAGVFGRRFTVLGVPPVLVAAGQVTASTLLLLPVAWVMDDPLSLPAPDLPVAASVLALALVSTAFAYILYFRILTSAGATNLSLVTFLVPVSAIWLSATILGELVTADQMIGMGLIGAGLIAIDGRLIKRFSA